MIRIATGMKIENGTLLWQLVRLAALPALHTRQLQHTVNTNKGGEEKCEDRSGRLVGH